jgi:cell fate (sporulation/competence/biofilm development) regulator YlbF (YheA/YmcA/DUF963 family)
LLKDREAEMAEAEDGRAAVTQRVLELVEALRAAPAIERYRTAEKRFRADKELGRMQAGLRWSHQQLQKAEREKRHDPRLFQEVRDGQARLQRHPLVVEFVQARQDAQDLLRETNQEMASILGVDIGGSVGPAGAC